MLTAGQEWGTDGGTTVSRQKKITADEYKEAKALLKSLKWDFDLKSSEEALIGQNLPQKVLDKMESAVRVMQKVERSQGGNFPSRRYTLCYHILCHTSTMHPTLL